MIRITSLYMLTITALGLSSHQEGIHRLKTAQIIVFFQMCFSSCPIFKPYVELSHIYTPCPSLDWLAEKVIALC